ncbi:hypothetical protein Ga0061061_1129 [Chelatococcus sambhunathii]|uniref:Lipoprotein n=1 Tax=Chelatococcus sambhunathii TaxID=363953 RepID=A0ABP2ABB7_9HYPH|nr:hypothetical protein [Chelatococcus sambhunathii]CUA90266.1 hypothetical protein Ga0061061_1129 [Chelatococcus sambhunathii]
MALTGVDGIASAPWMRAALRYGAIALAVFLFPLSLRRSGERAGRLAERLETSEKTNDSIAGCSMRRLAALAIVTISLTGCATVASDPRVATVCPPVVEYSREFQARAADELDLLPEGSALAEMLADYSVMRDQARIC